MTPESVYELKEKVASLQTALLELHPTIPVLLRTIHTQLRKDPELVTLLEEEEIGIIVNGLKKQTQTELVTTIVKEPKTTIAAIKKAAKTGTIEDLF